jgi:hypothetical protein
VCPYFVSVAEVGKQRLVSRPFDGRGHRVHVGLAQRDGVAASETAVMPGRSTRSMVRCRVLENLLPAKVLWIADSCAFHEAAAKTVSTRSARRDSRSGGTARGAGDGVPEVSRSKRQCSGQCSAPWRVSAPKRASTCRETRGPPAARMAEPTRFARPAPAGRRAKIRVLVFDMWIAQRPSDASRSGPLPKGARVPA